MSPVRRGRPHVASDARAVPYAQRTRVAAPPTERRLVVTCRYLRSRKGRGVGPSEYPAGVTDDTAEPGDPTSAPAADTVPLLSQDFTEATVTTLRHVLHAHVTAVGLAGDDGYDFVLAVHELVTNAVRHGGGRGRLELRRQQDVLICEVIDQGQSPARLPVRLSEVNTAGGRGLWLAHQLAGGLILTRRPDGVTATVTVCLEPATAGGAVTPGRPDGLAQDQPG